MPKNRKIDFDIKLYNKFPNYVVHDETVKVKSLKIEGMFTGSIFSLRNDFIYALEKAIVISHNIKVKVINNNIKVNIEYFDEFCTIQNIKKAIYSLEGFEDKKVKSDLSKLVDLKSILYFTDNTNNFEITGDEHLSFLKNENIEGCIAYSYDGTETGAGHAFDSTLIFLEVVATGFLVNLISENYRKFIGSRKKKFKPLVYLDLSKIVHDMLIEEHQVNPNCAEILELFSDQNTFDLHLRLKEKNKEFYFIIDRGNKVKKFEIKIKD